MYSKIEKDKLSICETKIACDGYECHNAERVVFEIDLKELAKALKPYIDSIPNSECKKGMKEKHEKQL